LITRTFQYVCNIIQTRRITVYSVFYYLSQEACSAEDSPSRHVLLLAIGHLALGPKEDPLEVHKISILSHHLQDGINRFTGLIRIQRSLSGR